jgi:topoisomerase-4 subunit A
VTARIHRPEGKLVLATRKGLGFVAPEAALVAQTRAGKQVVTLGEGDALAFAVPVQGEFVAVSGTNHKISIFPVADLPEQAKGKGVTLMRLEDASLADLVTFTAERGLAWRAGEKIRSFETWQAYRRRRGAAGRLAPRGFPKDHRFGL